MARGAERFGCTIDESERVKSRAALIREGSMLGERRRHAIGAPGTAARLLKQPSVPRTEPVPHVRAVQCLQSLLEVARPSGPEHARGERRVVQIPQAVPGAGERESAAQARHCIISFGNPNVARRQIDRLTGHKFAIYAGTWVS